MSMQITSTVLARASGAVSGTPSTYLGGRDRARQVAAATAAGLHGFLGELPEGYDTPIGDGAVVLSPAQEVAFAVARLLVADPTAVTLDDPTAGLDPIAERAVLPGIEVLLRGREARVVSASPAVEELALRYSAAAESHEPARALADGETMRACCPPDDPALPGLPLLLDAHAMALLLARSAPDVMIRDVRVDSVRYKPGDNVVVRYSVGTDTGWTTVVGYAAHGAKLRRKTKEPANRKLAKRARESAATNHPLAFVPEASALVQWMPLDVRLPMLCDDRARLTERLARKGMEAPAGAELQLLRYWPRRRAVLRLGDHVLKIYRDPGDYAQAKEGLLASRNLQNVRTPAFQEVKNRHLTTIQEFVPGQAPMFRPLCSQPAGALLADLHAERGQPLAVTGAGELLAKSANRAVLVAALLPDLAGRLDGLLARLARLLPQDETFVVSHGNFHAGQMLATRDGLVLLDLDRLCLAAPSYDLASFAAHVAFGRPGELELVRSTLDSLADGYGLRPRGLDWYLAGSLLRRAVVPFRYQDPHWPSAVTRLVDMAAEVLA